MVNQVRGRNLLIVDDDVALAGRFRDYFVNIGNTVAIAENIEQGIKYLKAQAFDAIILDIMLPDGEGTAILSKLPDLPPVIILSVLADEANMMEGFSLGARDYVVKPCSPELLEMRLSLRLLPKPLHTISLHGLCIDARARTLRYNGRPISLTGSEFNVLWFLMSNAGKFFTANEIFEHVWGENCLEQTSIKFHISNLRRKLIEHTDKQLILTKFGKGYTFTTEEQL